MSLRTELSAIHATLPSAERRVADFLMANPSEASHMIVSDIAKASRVSLPSVSRLTQRLGYNNFLKFRAALAEFAVEAHDRNADSIYEADSDEAFIKNLMMAQMHAMDSTFHTFYKEELCALADVFIAAKRIVFFGSAESLSIVYSINDRLIKMGFDSMMLFETDSAPKFASRLGAGDLLFALSRTGRGDSMHDSIYLAKKHGATTVFMSNYQNAPVGQLVDYFILTSRLEPSYRLFHFDTDSAQKALLEVFVALIARKKGYVKEKKTAPTVLD